MKAINLSTRRFGRLLVLHRDRWRRGSTRPRTYYVCQCDCGNVVSVLAWLLQSGKTSCGCDTKQKRSQSHTKHGHCKTGQRSQTYNAWTSMLNRCTPDGSRSTYHGARGIKVCARWQRYENFLKDMGEKKPGESLERKDNDKGYCKSNCRWIKVGNQSWNRRCTTWFRLDGEKLPLNVAAKRLGVQWHYLRGLMDGVGDLKAVKIIRAKCQE